MQSSKRNSEVRSKIIVVGSSNTDMVIKVKHLPKPGETIIGENFIMAQGGKGANQAVSAAKLGGNVSFIAKIGNDVFGDEAIRNFHLNDIDTEYISKDDSNSSGVALIFVDNNGENVIAVASGANAALSSQNIQAAKHQFKDANIILLQLETPVESVKCAAELGVNSNSIVILNPAPARELDDSLLQLITIITPNETEAQLLTGITVKDAESAREAAQVLKNRGVQNVIVTMGASGSFLLTNDASKMIPTKKVDAIDTTAAGDAFNGALAYYLAKGESIENAAYAANLVGAYTATKLGAQPSMPTLRVFCDFAKDELKNFVY